MSRSARGDLGRLPIDPRTGEPLPPRSQPGYYPGYSTVRQKGFWDKATRDTVLERLEPPLPVRFFRPAEAELLSAVLDRLLPQDDRDPAHRIPILPSIDERLFEGRGDGYRYEQMPPDREAYRLGLAAIEAMARLRYRRPFVELEPRDQELILKSLHDGRPEPQVEAWRRMSSHRFFLLVLHDASSVYYAHPWAWDEIGYGGPAYPRGYMRLERGEPEHWESEEQRYEWEPPPESVSAQPGLVAGTDDHKAKPGEGGTH